jgi:hypothetical protein
VIWAAVACSGKTGFAGGAGGTAKGTKARTRYTAGVTVSVKWPWRPPPRMEWTEAAFSLSSNCRSCNELNVGGVVAVAKIVRVWFGKLAAQAAAEVVAMVAEDLIKLFLATKSLKSNNQPRRGRKTFGKNCFIKL